MRLASVLGVVSLSGGLALALAHCSDDDPVAATTPDGGTDAASAPVDGGGTTPAPDAGGGGDAGGGTAREAFALDDQNQLLKFATTAPQTVTKVAITGAAAGTLVGIDFRPANGALYAYGSDARLYTVDAATGVATVVPGETDAGVATFDVTLDSTSTSYGFDFNPVADRIRVHNDRGQNFRLHPANGRSVNAAGDGTLTYEDGGVAAAIVGSAYTNSVSPKPSATALFGIDPALDQLNAFFSIDGGTTGGFAGVRRVGSLGVDVEAVAGFDIHGGSSDPDAGAPVATALEAYAAFTVGAETALYRVDLTTGAATKLGAIAHDRRLRGLAIRP
jgi:hypothetical protein